MNICKYGACEITITDISPKTDRPYYYCTEHRAIRNKRQMTKYRTNKEYKKKIDCRNSLYMQKLRQQFLSLYGGFCYCCGETFEPFLTLDHVRGDGKQHRKNNNNSRIYLDALKIKDIDRFQILCMNCNFAKGRHGHCPCKSRFEYEDYRDG
jgi:hypothetical protein